MINYEKGAGRNGKKKVQCGANHHQITGNRGTMQQRQHRSGSRPPIRYHGTDLLLGAGHKAYGGMNTTDAKRMKELEKENARLKKLVAELSLDNAILKDVNSKNY